MAANVKKSKDGKVIYAFDAKKAKGTYNLDNRSALYDLCKRIHFKGFTKLPKGFNSNGFGFATPAGTYLSEVLRNKFAKPASILITEKHKSAIKKRKKDTVIILNHGDYLKMLDELRTIQKERRLKSISLIQNQLSILFPKQFKKGADVKSIFSYEEGKLSKIVKSDPDLLSHISKEDAETITDLFDKLTKEQNITFNKIALSEKSTRRNERVYIETVTKEFAKRLKNTGKSESDWQRFLEKYILLFNNSYIQVIQKQNISLAGKFPDFILVDVFGYLDIFEIKKPNTNLLKYDDSRENYFWDTEMSKAIVQTEKYVQDLVKHTSELKELIKRKTKQEVRIIRPRGFIIAGSSQQFSNDEMRDDFRLLANANKNVDVILYDELLNNLKNLGKRLSK